MRKIEKRLKTLFPELPAKVALGNMFEFYSIRRLARLLMVSPSTVYHFGARRGVFRQNNNHMPDRYSNLVASIEENEGIDIKEKLDVLHREHGTWERVASFLNVGGVMLKSFRRFMKILDKGPSVHKGDWMRKFEADRRSHAQWLKK